MALAWVEQSGGVGGGPTLDVHTGSGSPFFEIVLATRPELIRPESSRERGPDNYYSTREQNGRLLRAHDGRAVFPLPDHLLRRFGNASVYYLVRTFRDAAGNGPAESPVMSPDSTPIEQNSAVEESMPVTSHMKSSFRGRNGRPAAVSLSNAADEPTAVLSPASAATPPRVTPEPELAGALALVAARIEAMLARDPNLPGRPSARDIMRVLGTILAELPAPDGRSSAAGYLAARICGTRDRRGGARRLQRATESAARSLGRPTGRSREMFFPAIMAALGPVLTNVLPAVLPALLPMLQKLLGGLAKGKSATAMSREFGARGIPMAAAGLRADGGVSREQAIAALAPLAAMLPQLIPILIQVLPALAGAIPALLQAIAPPPPPAKSASRDATTAAAAPTAAPVDASQLQQLLGALTGAGGGAGGASGDGAAGAGALAGLLGKLDPASLAQLLQAGSGVVQGIGGADGINKLLGGPGHEIVKSIVDRLPIEKMFDGKAWVPEIQHDEWIRTLPWQSVLSLSDSTARLGVLALPGRSQLAALTGVNVKITSRSMTELDGRHRSWIFLADRPARFTLEVSTGAEGLEQPFVDVRVSGDGSPSTGFMRSVFRLRSLAPSISRSVTIEVPPAVLDAAARRGTAACLSIRIAESRSPHHHRATETRACFHAVRRHTIVFESGGAMRASAALDELAGLERRVPTAAFADGVRSVHWAVSVDADASVGLARHTPVRRVERDGEAALEGGLSISPLGIADLARRLDENRLDPDGVAALRAALLADAATRSRLRLEARELLPSAPAASGGTVGVRVHLGVVPAYLVSFHGESTAGNPASRQVRRIGLPVPRGISVLG